MIPSNSRLPAPRGSSRIQVVYGLSRLSAISVLGLATSLTPALALIRNKERSRQIARSALFGSTMLGLLLVLFNCVGELQSLRAEEVDSYADFSRASTLSFEVALGLLEDLEPNDPREFVTQATRIFHQGMAHISLEDVEERGLEHYRMRIPVWENYVLYALSFVKPDTYRDYELCDYRRALQRGTGLCGQQALALVSFLSSQGLETGFVNLGGHTIATAMVAQNEWYLLDPDYGGVIPFDLAQAEATPERVLDHYWSSAALERRVDLLFQPADNEVHYGGPEARFRRASRIESAAYGLKWLLPLVMLLPLSVYLSRRWTLRTGLLRLWHSRTLAIRAASRQSSLAWPHKGPSRLNPFGLSNVASYGTMC